MVIVYFPQEGGITMTYEVNRKHKDRLFTILFGRSENKEWALELYNAVNDSHYDNPDDVEITTLEDAVYIGMKNDASFILNEYMNIYEQQSTYNPNMPLRQLMYVGQLYDKYRSKNKLNVFGTALVPIPIPKLVVFYNGTDKDTEDEQMLYLSDAFIDKGKAEEADISVRVRMLNINYGRNKKLLEACRPLAEYSWFINKIRYNQSVLALEAKEAVNRAIDEMPEDYVIYPFLVEHRSEVQMGFLTGISEEELKELFMEDGRKDTLSEQIGKKIAKGKTLETIADELEVTTDEIRDIYDKLCKEESVL